MVIVPVPVPPCVTATEVGDAPMVKFGVGGAFTVREIVAVCVVAPEDPVIVTVAVPVVAVPDAVSVSVEVASPFAGGVTGLVENAAVTPLGNPEALIVVAELKSFTLVTVMMLVPWEPRVMVREDGAALTVKSGAVMPRLGNLKLGTLGCHLSEP